MSMSDKEKLNPLRLINVRVPVSIFDLRHPLVHTAVDGKPVSLSFHDVTGPRDRPRRPHEFDFHEFDLLPLSECLSCRHYSKNARFDQEAMCSRLGQNAFSFRIPHSEFRIFDLSP
jgi:hypothetical protein